MERTLEDKREHNVLWFALNDAKKRLQEFEDKLFTTFVVKKALFEKAIWQRSERRIGKAEAAGLKKFRNTEVLTAPKWRERKSEHPRRGLPWGM